MKNNIFFAIFLATIMCCADESKPYDPAKDRPTSPEQAAMRKAWVEKRRQEHFGGELVKPGSRKGQIVVVNCQKAVDTAILDEGIAYLVKETKFDIIRGTGEFILPKPKLTGDFSMFVVDDANLPTMLLAPENKWAALNVAPLRTGRGEQQAFLKARVLKEMSRTFAGLCGGISSNYPDSLTTGIYNLDQLDRQEDNRLSVDVISRFGPCLLNAGITPAIITSYRVACKQGWAPVPTNDVQKAIWEEMHKLPEKPIKIDFDPKKGK